MLVTGTADGGPTFSITKGQNMNRQRSARVWREHCPVCESSVLTRFPKSRGIDPKMRDANTRQHLEPAARPRIPLSNRQKP